MLHLGRHVLVELMYLYAIGNFLSKHGGGLILAVVLSGIIGLGDVVVVNGPSSLGNSMHMELIVFFSGNTEQFRAAGHGKPTCFKMGRQRLYKNITEICGTFIKHESCHPCRIYM